MYQIVGQPWKEIVKVRTDILQEYYIIVPIIIFNVAKLLYWQPNSFIYWWTKDDIMDVIYGYPS